MASAELLGRVRAGEISREGYVATRVQEATAHLGGLPPEQLASIQQDLRERCENEPVLRELVDRATN